MPEPVPAGKPTGEDCLFLDVMVPAGARPGQRLPVMHEVHGGGFIGEALTDNGQNLVRSGHAVYVYVGYRLGILGFVANKAVGPHSGDYGLQDQQAGLGTAQHRSLRWRPAQRHDLRRIRQRGKRVRSGRLADREGPVPERHQHQRLLQLQRQHHLVAGRLQVKLQTEAQAQKEGAQFAVKVGCGDTRQVLACLRALPTATLVKQAAQVLDLWAP